MEKKSTLFAPEHRRNMLVGLFSLSMLWLGPALACGSFQPREAPTVVPIPADTTLGSDNNDNSSSSDGVASSDQSVQATPVPAVATATLPPSPTPTFTVTPLPGTALISGQPARVVAPNGLNMRQSPSSSSQLILQLGNGQRVVVQAGPQQADGYTWWQVEDQQNNIGWVAERDSETVWLSPQVGEPQTVNRPLQIGDRVRVTMESGLQLTVRGLPGTDGPLITRVSTGAEFTVVNGPQAANGYNWYEIRSDDGQTRGWAVDTDLEGQNRWLSPIE